MLLLRIGCKHRHRELCEFGGCVHWMHLKLGSKTSRDIEASLRDGIWLGLLLDSGEPFICTYCGILRARTVRRRAPDGQWNAEARTSEVHRGSRTLRAVGWRSMLCLELVKTLVQLNLDMVHLNNARSCEEPWGKLVQRNQLSRGMCRRHPEERSEGRGR